MLYKTGNLKSLGEDLLKYIPCDWSGTEVLSSEVNAVVVRRWRQLQECGCPCIINISFCLNSIIYSGYLVWCDQVHICKMK